MAVTQISKITVRRGKRANLPQLSYGEIGWAVDTRQLFIGNGSLTDGILVTEALQHCRILFIITVHPAFLMLI